MDATVQILGIVEEKKVGILAEISLMVVIVILEVDLIGIGIRIKISTRTTKNCETETKWKDVGFSGVAAMMILGMTRRIMMDIGIANNLGM